MELRKTEETMNELLEMYQSLRQSPVWKSHLEEKEDNDASGGKAMADQFLPLPAATQAQAQAPVMPSVSSLDSLQEFCAKLEELQQKLTRLTDKFQGYRKRLLETDPVTGNPRYGAKTQERVQRLVTIYYDCLTTYIPLPTTTTTTTTTETTTNTTDTAPPPPPSHAMLQSIQVECANQEAASEQAMQQQKEESLKRILAQEEAAAREEQETEERLQAEARQAAEREAQRNAELHEQAQQAKAQRLAKKQQELDWVAAIGKGPGRVQYYLQRLSESTATSKEAHRTALTSLLTIFEQITKHPDNVNFRRIRRDHAKFVQDIGQYEGGIEVLIAAGFTLGAIDDVPCYLCQEPNLETDMDAWSEWFDLLQATLNILQEAAAKLK